MTRKKAELTGLAVYAFALVVLFIVLLMLSGGSGFAATAGGESPEEWIQFETLLSNSTTGFATLDEAYTYVIYEFSLTGSNDKTVHIKHRLSNVARFTNSTVNAIPLTAKEWWLHRVVIKSDGVQAAKIQCVSGCGTGETITTRGTYIK